MIINKICEQDVFEFLSILDDESVDLAIIDPPYNLKVAQWDNFKNQDEFLAFSFLWLEIMLKKLKKTGSFYIFNTPFNAALFVGYLRGKAQFQNFISWQKKDGFSASKKRFNTAQEAILFYTKSSEYFFDCEAVRVPYESVDRIKHASQKGILKNGKRWFPNPNGKLCTDIWEFSSVRHTNKINGKTQKQNHPTPKPQAMIERMIKASSKSGDLVLDLFSGTGIVCKVAHELGRNFIACEKNIEYINKDLTWALKRI